MAAAIGANLPIDEPVGNRVIDIGGGTSKIAVCEAGEVIDMTAVDVGARIVSFDADGTVTRYGHINSWDVQIGQRVFAGDPIATIGNRGNSTGPHLHLSVLLDGVNPIDPVSWMAARGVSLSG